MHTSHTSAQHTYKIQIIKLVAQQHISKTMCDRFSESNWKRNLFYQSSSRGKVLCDLQFLHDHNGLVLLATQSTSDAFHQSNHPQRAHVAIISILVRVLSRIIRLDNIALNLKSNWIDDSPSLCILVASASNPSSAAASMASGNVFLFLSSFDSVHTYNFAWRNYVEMREKLIHIFQTLPVPLCKRNI